MKKKFALAFLPFLALTLSGCSFNSMIHKLFNSHEWQEFSYDETHHWKECSGCEEISEEGEHVFSDWEVVVEPTCTEEGLQERRCEECGYTEQEAIPELGHNLSSSWSHDEEHHWKECSECDEVFYLDDHDFGAWNIETYPTCTTKGHKSRSCHVCGYTEHEDIEPNGHSMKQEYEYDDEYHWHECEHCDEKLEVEPHSFGEWILDQEPTCYSYGHRYKECVCGYTIEQILAKTDHSYGDWIIDTPATPFDEGLMHHDCIHCGHTEEEIIPMLVVHYEVINFKIYLVSNEGAIQVNMDYENHHFNEDGELVLNNSFVVINGNTYYLVNNVIQVGFMLISNYLYYFGTDGIMAQSITLTNLDLSGDGVNDTLSFNASGICSYDGTLVFTLDGANYFVISGTSIYQSADVYVQVFESDDDLNSNNNVALNSYTAKLVSSSGSEQSFSGNSSELFLGHLDFGTYELVLSASGFKTRTVTITVNRPTMHFKYFIDKNINCALNGRVLIADNDYDYNNNSPLSGATLSLVRVGEYVEISEPVVVTSNSNGNYTFTGLTAGVYEITISKEGYKDVFDVVYINSAYTTLQNVLIEAIDNQNVENGSIAGQVRDATVQTVTPIAGISVKVRSGVNVTYGDPIYTATTGSDGKYFIEVEPGNYTLEFVDERTGEITKQYSSSSIAVKVMSGVALTGQDVALSPKVNGIRIVLTWGATPSDLDSHTIFKGSEHIYFSNKTVLGYGNLDVDDTSSYGPETTTITRTDVSFTYYVHDWTNKNNSSSTAMSKSGAVVKVYFGDSSNEMQYTFNVPSGSGYYWNVFSYSATTGRITFNNWINTSVPSAPSN